MPRSDRVVVTEDREHHPVLAYSTALCVLDLLCTDCGGVLARLTDQQRMADNNAVDRWSRGLKLPTAMVEESLRKFMAERAYPCVTLR